MRYVGGGVGHCQVYLTIDHAREQSHPARRARLRRQREPANGARVVGENMEHREVDVDDADEQSDDEDAPTAKDTEASHEDEDAENNIDVMHPALERSPARGACE